MFRGSVKSTGYPLHFPVSPSLALPCVTVCHHISTGLYNQYSRFRMSDVKNVVSLEALFLIKRNMTIDTIGP